MSTHDEIRKILCAYSSYVEQGHFCLSKYSTIARDSVNTKSVLIDYICRLIWALAVCICLAWLI